MEDGTIAECIEVAQEEIQENNEIRQRNPTDINIQKETGDKLDRLHRYVNALQRFHSNQDIQDFINTTGDMIKIYCEDDNHHAYLVQPTYFISRSTKGFLFHNPWSIYFLFEISTKGKLFISLLKIDITI